MILNTRESDISKEKEKKGYKELLANCVCLFGSMHHIEERLNKGPRILMKKANKTKMNEDKTKKREEKRNVRERQYGIGKQKCQRIQVRAIICG